MFGRWFAPVFLALLFSCGDSGVGSGGSGFPTGQQSGTVNGFGSVIVESTAYDDTIAAVTLDLDGESTGTPTVDDIRLGMQVRLAFDEGEIAQSIEIDPQLIGSIDSVDSNHVVVSGQTVSVLSGGARATVFEGFDQLSDLLPDDRLMVFGLFGEFGRLYATRLQRQTPGPQGFVKVTGTIGLIGPLQRTLRMGDLTVVIDDKTRSDTAIADLRIGDLISVWGNDTGPGRVQARRIALGEPRPALGSVKRFVGFVRQAPVNGVAIVGRQRVDVSQASYVNGLASDLVPGRLVLVGARVDENRLAAQSINYLDLSGEGEVIVLGVISGFTPGVSVVVRNTQVDIRREDLTFVGGDAADLALQIRVKVRGVIIDGKLQARQIEFRS